MAWASEPDPMATFPFWQRNYSQRQYCPYHRRERYLQRPLHIARLKGRPAQWLCCTVGGCIGANGDGVLCGVCSAYFRKIIGFVTNGHIIAILRIIQGLFRFESLTCLGANGYIVVAVDIGTCFITDCDICCSYHILSCCNTNGNEGTIYIGPFASDPTPARFPMEISPPLVATAPLPKAWALGALLVAPNPMARESSLALALFPKAILFFQRMLCSR